MDDFGLLQEYALRGSEAAFSELVQRHVNLVFSAARRQVGDVESAEDVTQRVFLLLARKGPRIGRKQPISGWLYRATRYVAWEHRRRESRRRVREAKAMSTALDNRAEDSSESTWKSVEPLIDDAMASLSQKDRQAVLLRHFEGKSLREIGAIFNISDDAAQKRVDRAMVKLRTRLVKRGLTVPCTILTVCLSSFAVQAAPSGLVSACAAKVLASASAVGAWALAWEGLKFSLLTELKTQVAAGLLASLSAGLLLLTSAQLVLPSAGTRWALADPKDALIRECDLIVNCSFTEHTVNYRVYPFAQPGDDAYGAINYDRVAGWGVDWVRVGDAAVATLGLMAATKQLQKLDYDVSTYDSVLNKFFTVWLLERNQCVNTNWNQPDAGAMYRRVYYTREGQRTNREQTSTRATARMISAMWNYYEYNLAMGRHDRATNWLRQSWPIVRRAGNYLRRVYHPQLRLVRETLSTEDLELAESVWSVIALRCLDRWHAVTGIPPAYEYDRMADEIVSGIQQMRDPSDLHNFFLARLSRQGHVPTYAGAIETGCFLPYEAEVLDPGESFCRMISDWWTEGSSDIRMTFPTSDPQDWRYFACFPRAYLTNRSIVDVNRTNDAIAMSSPAGESFVQEGQRAAGRPDTALCSEATLQLAKLEWKHWLKTGDPVVRERARQRLRWVASPDYSALWFGATRGAEERVPNGIVSWRDSVNYDAVAPGWARYCDVSAYFIELVLMIYYDVNPQYAPGV